MKAWGGRALMVVLLAMALSLGLFTAPAPAQKFADFVNQKFKFATQLPSHWESAVKDNSLIFPGPKGSEDFNVTINFQFINRKSQDSLEAQGQDLERQLATFPGYKLLSREKGRISGQPALRLVMVYQASAVRRRALSTRSAFCGTRSILLLHRIHCAPTSFQKV